jgi:hypothetical protein
VGEYISEALSVKLSSRIGHVAASTESEETAAVSKRKSDWEMALELEKETGAQYSAAPAKKLAEPPAKVVLYVHRLFSQLLVVTVWCICVEAQGRGSEELCASFGGQVHH